MLMLDENAWEIRYSNLPFEFLARQDFPTDFPVSLAAASIPMEIIFQIIEEIASLPRPLAYAHESSALQTLVSFTRVCQATNRFTIPILYSRMCIESVAQMRCVTHADPRHLRNVRSLYIRFPEIHMREDTDELRYMLKYGNVRNRAAVLREITEYLQYLLRAVQGSVERLALTVPVEWEYPRTSRPQAERDALMQFWAELRRALTAVTPNLTEFIFPRSASLLEEFVRGPYHCWKRLRRASFGCVLYTAMLTCPELDKIECLCVTPSGDDSDFGMGTVDPVSSMNRSLRKTIAFYETKRLPDPWVESGLHRIGEHLVEVGNLNEVSRWPIEVVLVGMREACEIRLEVVKLAREGLLWDIGDIAGKEDDKRGTVSVTVCSVSDALRSLRDEPLVTGQSNVGDW